MGTPEDQKKELIPDKEASFDAGRSPGDRREGVLEIPDAEMLRYHDIHLPKCRKCFRRWPYPRDVSFLAGVPIDMRNDKKVLSDFEPVTKDSLVVYQTWDRQTEKPHLREEIFQRLKLTHSIRTKRGLASRLMCKGPLDFHRLVTEFDYNRKTGDVTHCSEFFEEEQEEDFRYARLITLNSWYLVLFKNIVSIIVDIFSIATGLMMLGQLFSEKGGFRYVCWVQNTRVYFACWYAASLVLAALYSAKAAHWEWKANSSPSVGDVVVKCHKIDRCLSFSALTLLIFLGVDKLIKDIVVILHPWKSVQPYAAVKIEGVRVHVVGYKSRPLFHVENSSGQFKVLLVLCAQKMISLIYKVSILLAIAYQNDMFGGLLGQPPLDPEQQKRKTHLDLLLQNKSAEGKSALAEECKKYRDDLRDSYCNLPGKSPFMSALTNQGCSIPFQFTLIISTAVSLVSATIAVHKVHKLRQQRRLFKDELVRILDFAEQKGDEAKKGPASKLLALHYHKEYKHAKLENVTPGKFRAAEEDKCSACGRLKEDWSPDGLCNSIQVQHADAIR